jgi:hypothetical protein
MLETDSKQQILTEINNFEKMIIKVNDQSNPLEFYKYNQGVFKHLSNFAKLFFSLLASSTASEGSFSNAEELISDRRNRISPEHAKNCLFLSQNKRLEK